MPSSPLCCTRPAERAVPYGWTQTLQDVTVLFPVPKTTKGKDVVVEFGKTHLKAGLKGQPLLIDVRAHARTSVLHDHHTPRTHKAGMRDAGREQGELHKAVKVGDCFWSVGTRVSTGARQRARR